MKTRIIQLLLLAAFLGATLYLGLFWFLLNSVWPSDISDKLQTADPDRLERDVRFLLSLVPPRNAQNVDGLYRIAVNF